MRPARPFLVVLLLSTLLSPVAARSQGWIQSTESDGIVYFLFSEGDSIERFDLEAQAWLDPILLNDTPTAFAVDPDGIFIAFGSRASRISLDGVTETPLKNTTASIQGVRTDGNLLFLVAWDDVWTVDKFTGNTLDEADYFYSMRGLSISRSGNRLFGRSSNVSPADIVAVEYDDLGTLIRQFDSPHHGSYPNASETWVFPDEARVIDSAGIIYRGNDLGFSGAMGGPLDDLTFFVDLPIALRGDTLFAYSNALLETGRYTLSSPATEIVSHGENVFAFSDGSTQLIDVEVVPIYAFGPLDPGQPVDPLGIPYAPDHVIHGSDGVVYLLSKHHLSIFRWSTQTRSYLPTIPLAEAPRYMAYSGVNEQIYLAYPDGRLTAIDATDPGSEQPFANSPMPPCGLQTAEEYVFVCDPSGAWESHFSWGPDGSLIDQRDWNYPSREWAWSSVNRRMYFFRDGTSPNDLHFEEILPDGRFGAEGETPYHSSTGIQPPIRVAPDGSVVLLGSGRIYDALSMVLLDTLSNAIDDATWMDGKLFTLRLHNENAEVQEWNEQNFIDDSFGVLGDPLRIFPLQGELLILTSRDGVPTFNIKQPGDMDLDDDGIEDPSDNCPAAPNPGQEDVNGDGIGDACQPNDGDGDGWPDNRDNCPGVFNPTQADADDDGVGDLCEPPDADGDNVGDGIDNCPLVPNPDQADADDDGVGDACEPDWDGDGVINDLDNCLLHYNPDQSDADGDGVGDACTPPDLDGDGVLNASDNCPRAYNPTQEDADGDGIGDACEPDSDQDGVIDDVDNCPTVWNPDQSDANGDGFGDACQPVDRDQDGWLDPLDNCPTHYNPAQNDADGDGIGDVCEADSDSDGVIDDVDNCPAFPNPSQSDVNGDGVGDSCQPMDSDHDGWPLSEDNCSDEPNPMQQDTDGDQIGNRCDCDFDQSGGCGIADFGVFRIDYVSGTDQGSGTDMNGDGGVSIHDFGLFMLGFIRGAPGPSGLIP